MSWFNRLSATRRTLIIGAAAVVVIGAAIFDWLVLGPGPMDFAGGKRVALADYRGADPTGVPPELAHESLVRRGEYLTRAADCSSCHTAIGGAPYAGGRAFTISIGTLYSSNITPDKDTGIGETGTTAAPPAVRNAIYAATGIALRRLPIDRDVLAGRRRP